MRELDTKANTNTPDKMQPAPLNQLDQLAPSAHNQNETTPVAGSSAQPFVEPVQPPLLKQDPSPAKAQSPKLPILQVAATTDKKKLDIEDRIIKKEKKE